MMLNHKNVLVTAVIIAAFFFGASAIAAQDPPSENVAGPVDPNAEPLTLPTEPEPVIETLTLESFEAGKKRALETEGLTDDEKTRLTETYDQAITAFKTAEQMAARRRQFRQKREAAPTALETAKKQLETFPEQIEPNVPPDLTLSAAEQNLNTATQQLQEARDKAAELEAEPKRRGDRRTQVLEESKTAQQQIEALDEKLAAADSPQTTLDRARVLLWQLQKQAARNRIEAGSEELSFYDASGELLTAQRDLAARRLAAARKIADFWQNKVSTMQEQAAEQARRQAIAAKQQTRYSDSAIRDIAEENAALAEQQAELLEKIQKTTAYSETIATGLTELEASYRQLQQQVETAGEVTDTMGILLLGQRDKLPDVSEHRVQMRDRPEKLAFAQLRAMEYDRRWSELSDLAEQKKQFIESLDASVGSERSQQLWDQARSFYESRRNLLRTISDLYWDYATKLAALDRNEKSYVQLIDQFYDFIDENVLWVRGRRGIRPEDFRLSAEALRWFFSPQNWGIFARSLLKDFKNDPLFYGMLAALSASFIVLGRKLRARTRAIAEKVRQARTDRFRYTLTVLVFTTVMAAQWGVFLILISHRLSEVSTGNFGKAVAEALLHLSWVFAVLLFLRYLAMPCGLAQTHFRMRSEAAGFLRRQLGWFAATWLPVVFLFEVMRRQQQNELWYATAGRLLFIVGLVQLSIFLALLLHPKRPLIDFYLKKTRDGWLLRLRYFWYVPAVIIPIVFAILAAMGFLYGAYHLTQRLLFTLGLILVVLMVRGLCVRSIVIAQRRLALFERIKRLVSRQEEAAAPEPQTAPKADDPDAKAGREQTIFEMSQQTRHVIGIISTIVLLAGLWYIWSDVLPALAGLGHFELYRVADRSITLGAIVAAAAIVTLTIVFARNAPGLLEIAVLRRLPIDKGVRFAIITICRYVIVVIGVVLAFTEIGIGWSKVQWLIAAMTVGLGFGLQEIFANFVSGLIILFEQPIRVGDVVTVGEVAGTVTQIRIRATTIRQWDRKELIVPNKEFITGRLVNWSLSDSTLRLAVAVGIAYGSDVRKAEKTLYKIAADDSRILTEPAPLVLFKEFGSSSLDFELRVYIAGIGHYLPVIHDLHVAIDDAFRAAGIEIAFPQRDLHLRTVTPKAAYNLQSPQPE